MASCCLKGIDGNMTGVPAHDGTSTVTEITKWEFEESSEEIPSTSFASGGVTEVCEGAATFSFTFEAIGCKAPATTRNVAAASLPSISLITDAVDGSGPTYSGTARITSIKVTTSVDDLVKYSGAGQFVEEPTVT